MMKIIGNVDIKEEVVVCEDLEPGTVFVFIKDEDKELYMTTDNEYCIIRLSNGELINFTSDFGIGFDENSPVKEINVELHIL